MLVRNKFFWLATVLFLGFSLAIVWLSYPPVLRKFADQKGQAAKLEAQIIEHRQFLATVKNLETAKEELDALYQQAQSALPVNEGADRLILQLDGLAADLNLADPIVTVPFSKSAAGATSATAAPVDLTNEVKPKTSGSMSKTPAPATKSPVGTAISFTIGGKGDFGKLKTALEKLTAFSRWNNLTAFEFNQADQEATITVTADAFSQSEPTAGEKSTFEANLLTRAKQEFGRLKSYAPPLSLEQGNYGRNDPFAPVN